MKKRFMAGMVLAAGIVGVASLALASATLDGKTFAGTIGKKGETAGQPDNFVFKDGTFESTLCETFGYGTGLYTTSMTGDAVQFNSETTNPKGGKMAWTGTVASGRIEGSVVTTENGASSEMWFNGTATTKHD